MTNGDLATGLPVYPGARALITAGNVTRASVRSGHTGHGLDVMAIQLTSDDTPAAIVDFYRREMEKYGAVTECRETLRTTNHRSPRVDLFVSAGGSHCVVTIERQSRVTAIDLVHIQADGRTGATGA